MISDFRLSIDDLTVQPTVFKPVVSVDAVVFKLFSIPFFTVDKPESICDAVVLSDASRPCSTVVNASFALLTAVHCPSL